MSVLEWDEGAPAETESTGLSRRWLISNVERPQAGAAGENDPQRRVGNCEPAPVDGGDEALGSFPLVGVEENYAARPSSGLAGSRVERGAVSSRRELVLGSPAS